MTRGRIVFAAAVLLTWGMAGPARALAGLLREQGLLTTAATAAVGLAAGAMAPAPPPGEEKVRWGEFLPFLATVAGVVAVSLLWDLPEERFHLAIYPLLGRLAWHVLSNVPRGRTLAAIALVVTVGLVDELFQGLHPARQFDWMDVIANAVGGAVFPLLALGPPRAWAAPGLLLLFALSFHPLQQLLGNAPPLPESLTPVHAPRTPEPAPAQTPSGGDYTGFHVVLVTIDALRADHVPPVGHAPVATPTLDAFAADSVACTEAWAAGTWTSPSMVSMLSGLHPAVHGVNDRGLNIAAGPVLPLETLAAAGWTVLGHAGDPTENYRNLGIPTELDRSDEAAAVGAALTNADGPVFAWVHLRDVHAPYDASPERLAELGLDVDLPESPLLDRARTHVTVPRSDFPGRHDWLAPAIRALYAAEVADADASLGRVLAAIEASGEGERTIVVLSADHGEELVETDAIGHASTTLMSIPHDFLQRIPLLVRLPDGRGAGTTFDGTVRQHDLLPTLLPMLGVVHPPLSDDPGLHGVAHALLDDPSEPPPPLWFFTSPCGWQCPTERRGERISTVVTHGSGDHCRVHATSDEVGVGCGAHVSPLRAARALANTLGSPVAE